MALTGKKVIVSKFGGSVMGTVEGVKRAIEIIKSNPLRRYLTSSAPGQTSNRIGITDMLFMCHSSFNNRENYVELLNRISECYSEIINALGIEFDLDSEIKSLHKDLASGKSADYIGSRGEYIMGKILAEALGWEFLDASEIIFFNDNGTLDKEKTFSAVNERIKSVDCAVIPGFYGAMPDGNIKTFPRGDGDSTGAIVASAIKADLFEKWSETAKFFSADPAVVSDVKVIKNITYTEAIEFNYVGVNAIRDSVIFILKNANVPLKICSIYDDENNGMLVSSTLPKDASRNVAVCIAGRKNYNIIHIEKYGLNKIYGFGEKLFGLFAKYHIACEHCLSGIYKMSVVLKSPAFVLKRNEFLEELKRVIDPDAITIENNLSLIAVIGKGMGAIQGTFAPIFSALAKEGIKVRVIDQGSDDLNIILGVSDGDYEHAIRALYDNIILK